MPQQVGVVSEAEVLSASAAPAAPIDGKLFRQVMGLFVTGITVITADDGGRTHGMTANAFMAGSLAPPLCVISVGKRTRLHEVLLRSDRYGVSLLTQEQSHLSSHFAGRGILDIGPEFRRIDGVPVLARALAVIAADVVGRVGCGDHTLFVGRITAMDASPAPPLVYFRSRYARLSAAGANEQTDPPTFW